MKKHNNIKKKEIKEIVRKKYELIVMQFLKEMLHMNRLSVCKHNCVKQFSNV